MLINNNLDSKKQKVSSHCIPETKKKKTKTKRPFDSISMLVGVQSSLHRHQPSVAVVAVATVPVAGEDHGTKDAAVRPLR